MEDSNTIPGAGPFCFDGSSIGILMIHGGGGGTCADLKPVAKDLHEQGGYTIHLPLLPGFGSTPEQLRETSVSAWKMALDKEINSLKQKCEKIIVGGHSMGGILSLILASKYEFEGIFPISTPIGIKWSSAELFPFLFKWLVYKLSPFSKSSMMYYSVGAEKLRQETNNKWVGYDKMPFNIAPKARKLMKEMKMVLSQIKCPVLFLQGRLDSIIKKESMDILFNRVSSKNKRKVWLENTDHPILLCPDHDQIVSELLTFIRRICV
ncbi:MAG: alpha/beta hydrolase [Candidatus Hodarchaeota archaeon]